MSPTHAKTTYLKVFHSAYKAYFIRHLQASLSSAGREEGKNVGFGSQHAGC